MSEDTYVKPSSIPATDHQGRFKEVTYFFLGRFRFGFGLAYLFNPALLNVKINGGFKKLSPKSLLNGNFTVTKAL